MLGGLLLSDIAELFVATYCVKMRGGCYRFQAQYLRRIRVPAVQSVGKRDQPTSRRKAFENRDRDRAHAQSPRRLYGVERDHRAWRQTDGQRAPRLHREGSCGGRVVLGRSGISSAAVGGARRRSTQACGPRSPAAVTSTRSQLLLVDVLVDAGIPAEMLEVKRRPIPGYFRRDKSWDIVVTVQGRVLAIIELKSIVGNNPGQNFNNRTDEALGQAIDVWKAVERGIIDSPLRPWLGYFMLIEDNEAWNRVSPAAAAGLARGPGLRRHQRCRPSRDLLRPHGAGTTPRRCLRDDGKPLDRRRPLFEADAVVSVARCCDGGSNAAVHRDES